MMIGFSSLLLSNQIYSKDASLLFSKLRGNDISYCFIDGAKDIWARDYMPIKNSVGDYISFRYEPLYLQGYEHLKTDFKSDINSSAKYCVVYSDIVLDGGNVVFSPSKQKAIVSDRIFLENPQYDKNDLILRLETLLKTKIIVIPSLKSDMTGHADGTVRFLNENTVLCNATPYKNGYEQKVKRLLSGQDISVIDFPYFESGGISAVGLYLNYLECGNHIFLPIFGVSQDGVAIEFSNRIWNKKIVPIKCMSIAENGGGLNCISCEI